MRAWSARADMASERAAPNATISATSNPTTAAAGRARRTARGQRVCGVSAAYIRVPFP